MIYLTIVSLITIFHSYLDSVKIKNQVHIDHFWRTTIWFFVCMTPVPFLDSFNFYSIWAVSSLIVVRTALFDYSLNHFRNLRLNATSIKTGSFWDKLKQKHGINENLVRQIALSVLIFLYITAIVKNVL